MKLILSGMEDSFYHGKPNGWYDSFAEISRVTPEVFFSSACVARSRNHQETKVWVYSAPWNFLSTQHDKSSVLLDQWLKHSNRALALKREGINIEIVNVQAMSLHSFCQILGVDSPRKSESSDGDFTTNEQTIDLFKKWSPDIWLTYEKLEAVSWTIGEAHKSASGNSPVASQIINILANIQRKASTPLNGRSDMLVVSDNLSHDSDINSLEATVTQTGVDHRVVERASELSIALEQAKQELSKEKNKAQKALALQQMLEKELGDLRLEHIKITAEANHLYEENEQLIEKLNQVQLELESYYRDKIALENVLMDSKVTLDRARTAISCAASND